MPYGINNSNAAILEALNEKADLDLNNLNQVGASNISSLVAPSSKYVDLTAGSSGTQYTAPADGYFYVQTISTTGSGNSGVNLSSLDKSGNRIMYTRNTTYNNGWDLGTVLRVNKNLPVALGYVNERINQFSFIYAEGSY